VQEEGKGPETLGDFNTPQKESNKFEIRTWNSNFFFVYKFSCIGKSKLEFKFEGDGEINQKRKEKKNQAWAQLHVSFVPFELLSTLKKAQQEQKISWTLTWFQNQNQAKA
jgi:hypothetical protein